MNQDENRTKLACAIVAFDLIVDDILRTLESDKELHQGAKYIMEILMGQMSFIPDIPELKKEYIINMAEIGARVRLITLSMDLDASHIQKVLEIQREKLEILQKISTPSNPESTIH